MNKQEAIRAAIEENREAVKADCRELRDQLSTRDPWFALGWTLAHTCMKTPAGQRLIASSRDCPALRKALRLLPVAVAGYGAYQVARALSREWKSDRRLLSGGRRKGMHAPAGEWRAPTPGIAKPGW